VLSVIFWCHRFSGPVASNDLNGVQSRSADTLALDNGSAVEKLERVLREGKVRGTAYTKLLEEIGDEYSKLKRYNSALKYHKKALKLKSKTGAASNSAGLALSYASIASDYMNSFNLQEALKSVRKAQNLGSLPPEALAVLYQQEAAIHECTDDFVSALQRFEHAGKLSPASLATWEHTLKHLELLKRTVASSGDLMPAAVRSAMESRAQNIAARLIDRGPWVRTDQLPKTFFPGLLARPWHTLDEMRSRDWVDPSVRLVLGVFVDLQIEYDKLRQGGYMRRETECIHQHAGGEWRSFQINSPWEVLHDGCADATPVACRLFADLGKLGMPLIRAGYSVVNAHAWLKPHFGMTNGQLKWHLGLRIPSGGCATLRVANETRSWREGDLIFFDDSFEHEVWNRCKTERVVFQLVFMHPDLSTTTEYANNEVGWDIAQSSGH